MKTTKMNLKNLGVALKKSELRQIMAGSGGGTRCMGISCPDNVFCNSKACGFCINISEETGMGICY